MSISFKIWFEIVMAWKIFWDYKYLKSCQRQVFGIFNITNHNCMEPGLFCAHFVDIIIADALAPCITGPSVATILTAWKKKDR